MIKKIFKAAGYGDVTFIEAGDGREAVDRLKDNQVDVVVSNYHMPNMNGLDLIREMKRNGRFDELPVIIISTEGSKEIIDEFFAQGITDYIRKPFAPEQLRDALTGILGDMDYEESLDGEGDEFDF